MAEAGRRGTEVLEPVDVAVDWRALKDVLCVFVLENGRVWEAGLNAPAKDTKSKR